MCRLECPAAVDIPRLMRESKGAYVAANGLGPAQWAMDRAGSPGRLRFARSVPLANWALGNRQMRWLLEKIPGRGPRPQIAAR